MKRKYERSFIGDICDIEYDDTNYLLINEINNQQPDLRFIPNQDKLRQI